MASPPDWLPQLLLLEHYGGDWEAYFSELYAVFRSDFVATLPTFRGQRLSCKRHPLTEGKEATFWHLISEGKVEAERLPDIRRCERIRWPRAIIEHADDPAIKSWANERQGEQRILLWMEEQEYLVVLADRQKYVLIWTAYTVTRHHQKEKLRKEYLAAQKG